MQVSGIPSAQNIFEARYPVVEAIAFVTIVGTLSEFVELRAALARFGYLHIRSLKKYTDVDVDRIGIKLKQFRLPSLLFP